MPFDRIAVLMTCFNRCSVTLKSLKALYSLRDLNELKLQVFLVDDDSSDGTAIAVRNTFPEVQLIQGDGSLYWNGGMRAAFKAAMDISYDAYILLNDDTVLYEDAIARLVRCAEDAMNSGEPAIAVGSTRSPLTREHTYGGIEKQVRGITVSLKKIPPHPYLPVPCDAMNGNIVLIPSVISDKVGNLEAGFRHQFGDLDYALRARRLGFKVIVAPGYLGECSGNSSAGTWRDSSSPLRKRWKHMMSPKGLPISEWFLFARRHYGWRAMYYAFAPYAKMIVSSVFSRGPADAAVRVTCQAPDRAAGSNS
jgi:GT2 family glycosyltransferase